MRKSCQCFVSLVCFSLLKETKLCPSLVLRQKQTQQLQATVHTVDSVSLFYKHFLRTHQGAVARNFSA